MVTIIAKQSERVPITVPRRTTYGKITRKKQIEIIAQVGRQISTMYHSEFSLDYPSLVQLFSDAKMRFLGKRQNNHKTSPLSRAMLDLQDRFYKALSRWKKDKDDLSLFIAKNLEHLLTYQYQKEKNYKFSVWLRKMK